MYSGLFTSLRDSLLHQDVHACFHTLQHPKLHMGDLLKPSHKEWYFVVLENNLDKMIRCLDDSGGDEETLVRSLKVSVKLANAYARREELLDQSLQAINMAVWKDDPLATISALIEHNDNLNGIARDLVGTVSVKEIASSMVLQTRAELIHEELKAALKEKGKHLSYEEVLTIMRVLHRVIGLNEAVSVRNASKIMPILLAKDALWENVVQSNGDLGATYLCRLCDAQDEKSTETGELFKVLLKCIVCLPHHLFVLLFAYPKLLIIDLRVNLCAHSFRKLGELNSSDKHLFTGMPSILSHCEIQRIINEVAKAELCQRESSSALNMNDFEASTCAPEEVIIAPIACSDSTVKTCEYYLSRVHCSLTPGDEFVLWGWLQALRTTGYLSDVSSQLSSDHIDLYRCVLSTLTKRTASSVKEALQLAHNIHARALALGKVLRDINNFLQHPNGWQGLKNYILKLDSKRGSSPCCTALRLHVKRKCIEEYVEALFQIKTSKQEMNVSRGECSPRECHGWLVTSVSSMREEGHAEKEQWQEERVEENEKAIYFYFNIKSQRLIWKPSYTTPEPTYLEPDLLTREEIEACINRVNLGVQPPQSGLRKRISAEAFDLLDRLIRAWIIRQHYREWMLALCEKMRIIGEKKRLLRGICLYQAMWRGFCIRRRYKAYLQVLRSPNLQSAAIQILHFIRRQRRRRFVEQTVNGVRHVLKCIRRFQALWRGFALRQTLTTALVLALNPMSPSACERPLVTLARLLSSCLMPTLTDDIYNFQLNCFQAAQGVEDKAEQLMRLQDDIESASKLLQLVVQMRQAAMTSKARRAMLCFSTVTLCGDSRNLSHHLQPSQTSPTEVISEKYGGLLFLLYAQPDYLARLLVELPAHVLWVEKVEGVLETCKPTDFALRLERIILSLYDYGKRGGGEVRFTFLISRALHIQLHTTPWNEVKSMRSHFALRLAVAMTHVSHSTRGTVVKRLIPLLQNILTADTQREEGERRPSSRMPQGDGIASLHHTSHRAGNTRILQPTNAEGEGKVVVVMSKERNRSRWRDVTSTIEVDRGLCRTPSKGTNVSWLVHVAERLFFALFEEEGGVVLPSPLLVFIQEVFRLLRQRFPQQPIKDLLKFVGLHLFYRYIHSIILAPDAFATTDSESRESTPTVQRPEDVQRATLAGLSRLLCLVVENKGIASTTTTSGMVDETRTLNGLIKVWHVRFKAYLLKLIGDEKKCCEPSVGKLRRMANEWICRLSCSNAVVAEARNVTMNVDELVELHRLINAYRVKIAPNPDDPLHEEMKKVEHLPQVLYRHPGAKGNDGRTDEKLVWSVEVTKQRSSKGASGLEGFTLQDHITTKTTAAGLRLCEVPLLAGGRDRGGYTDGVGGVTRSSSSNNSNNTPVTSGQAQLDDRKESRNHEALFRYYRFKSSDTSDLVLPEGNQVHLCMRAKSAKEMGNACLYTARALGMSSTACFSFAARNCCSFHTRNAYSSNVHHGAAFISHTFLPDANSCVFCASERVHLRPPHFIYGWTETMPPTAKAIRPLGRSTSNTEVEGVAVGERFAIGETQRRTRFTIGQDGVVVSATPANREKIVWPAEARRFATLWTQAKQAMVHLLSSLTVHRDALSEEVLLEQRKRMSNVPSWFSLLRSWLTRAMEEGEDGHLEDGCALVKRLHEIINTLYSAICAIQTMRNEGITTLWHDLIVGVARDVLHMDAACATAEWKRISNRLVAVNCALEDRLQAGQAILTSAQQALCHALQPRCPLNSKFAIRCVVHSFSLPRSRAMVGVSLPFGYLMSHTILKEEEALCVFSGKQMRNMRLDVVAVPRATMVGGFGLTVFLLGVQWEEPEEIQLPHLLHSLCCGESSLVLFSHQLHFNLLPFIQMIFNKFYAAPLPTHPSSSTPPCPPPQSSPHSPLLPLPSFHTSSASFASANESDSDVTVKELVVDLAQAKVFGVDKWTSCQNRANIADLTMKGIWARDIDALAEAALTLTP
ncbi:unnamed protein product [Hydatigera taeniaeformis]|uniref:Ras-GAP domain-containing protein n=1 Tax=Hydatigena taeniaeformis TaxID=6205 RepID=A0A0R3WJ40_HYDTA|nr:unnamed protein product [Hydatigera taeniaeformis]